MVSQLARVSAGITWGDTTEATAEYGNFLVGRWLLLLIIFTLLKRLV